MAAPIYRGGPPFNGAYFRFKQSVGMPFLTNGAPTNGTSGTGAAKAGKGSMAIDYTNGVNYLNTGTKASPVWSAIANAAGGFQSVSPSVGIGYATGAGGAVTQITSRATGVTLSKITGQITTDNSSLAAEVSAVFTVTNTVVAIGDVVAVSIQSGTNGGNTAVNVTTVAAGSFAIRVSNNNAAGGTAETGAIIINFAVIKAVAA